MERDEQIGVGLLIHSYPCLGTGLLSRMYLLLIDLWEGSTGLVKCWFMQDEMDQSIKA